MTFTDDFVVSAWVKLSAYPAAVGAIASRYNGTSGWDLEIESDGTIVLIGFNAGGSNVSYVQSYQSAPLNKWVHIAAQLDMSAFTATTTTSYVMIDGVDVPAKVTRAGTNPTALVQAGNLEIGSRNGGANPLSGKLAQVAIYSAKVTQATILASMHQGLAGTETSLISAYSFNNSINDLNANANNLTANGSAVATNADSPFGGQADGTISSTLDYAIITKTAFSTNTTLTVQVPEGCTIPTSGGVSAVSYSTQSAPYLFPRSKRKWVLEHLNVNNASQGSPVAGTWYNNTGLQLTVPIGEWEVSYMGAFESFKTTTTSISGSATLSTANNSESDTDLTITNESDGASGNIALFTPVSMRKYLSFAAATPMYLNAKTGVSSATGVGFRGDSQKTIIRAENAYL
jgi:hypothetical protein